MEYMRLRQVSAFQTDIGSRWSNATSINPMPYRYSFKNSLTRRFKRLLTLAFVIASLALLVASLSYVFSIRRSSLYTFSSATHAPDSPTPAPTPAQANETSAPQNPRHWLVPGGQLEVNFGGSHPLYELIINAEARWKNMLKRQSTTLDAAIQEYQHRYGRCPPVGFDKWFEFARSVGFKLIDEFDQIDRDITPLLTLPHRVLRQRLESTSKEPHSYHMVIEKGKVTIAGQLSDWDIPSRLQKMVSDFAKDLPDMVMYVSGHDNGPTILGEDMRIAVNAALKNNQRLSEEQLAKLENIERNPRRGITNACLQDPSTLPRRNKHSHTLIYDHRVSMSFCANPAILDDPSKRHGYFAYDIPHSNQATPYFFQSQTSAGGALLHPALQSYASPKEYVRKYGNITTWNDRTNKVFWRGRTTGEWFNHQHDWRHSHRTRLHLIANPGGPLVDSDITPEVEILVDVESGRSLRLAHFPRDLLNESYMDVTLVGPQAVQCEDSKEDHTCQDMNTVLKWGNETHWGEGLDSKFLLDVDGNGWSSRFQRLLSSGAVILKMTIFPEWNSDWLIPYYHYVPIQTDYSDLYDSLAFFIGIPGGPPGQDQLAEKIGAHGHDFAFNHWRWEDMQVYVYRLLLEYARLVSEDRDGNTMP